MKRLALLCTLLLSSWAHAEDTACRRFQQQHAAQYADIYCADENTAVVSNGQGQDSLIDSQNRILVPFGTYRHIDRLQIFKPKDILLLEVFHQGKEGVIDGTGKPILPPQYNDIILPIADGEPIIMAVGRGDNKRYGLTDQSGNLLLPPRYQLIDRFSEGLAPYTADTLEQDGKINPHLRFGYLDTQGNSVIAPQFLQVRPFSHGVAWVKYTDNDAWILIDRTGKILPNPSDPAR